MYTLPCPALPALALPLRRPPLFVSSSLPLLRRRPSARLQHFLHQVVPHAPDALVLSDGQVRKVVVVAYVGGQDVAVLVRRPLVLRGVGVWEGGGRREKTVSGEKRDD